LAWSQLDISSTLDSVSAVPEGCQLNCCLILKLLSGPRIFKLLNLCGNHLITYPSCLCICSLCFWKKHSNSLIWNDFGRNCLLGHRKKIAKFSKRTFTRCSTFLYGTNNFTVNLPPSPPPLTSTGVPQAHICTLCISGGPVIF
jgi:hypothetical protein